MKPAEDDVMTEILDAMGSPLTEHAFERKTAMRTLENYQDRIAEHLLLAFTLPNHPAARGWEKELNAWKDSLVRRNIGKSGKKNFDTKDLIRIIWDEPLSTERDRSIVLGQLSKKGLDLPDQISNPEHFQKFVVYYIYAISKGTDFVIQSALEKSKS